jgi:hypothetical protein
VLDLLQRLGVELDVVVTAIFGNAGSIIAWRTGASDAPILAEQIGLGGENAQRFRRCR